MRDNKRALRPTVSGNAAPKKKAMTASGSESENNILSYESTCAEHHNESPYPAQPPVESGLKSESSKDEGDDIESEDSMLSYEEAYAEHHTEAEVMDHLCRTMPDERERV